MALTGSYNQQAHVIDMQRRINVTLDVKFQDKRSTKVGIGRKYKAKRLPLSVAQARE
jgi:hypothetical protein